MVKQSAVEPLIRATAGQATVHGDEVHVPLVVNPYPQGTQQNSDYENGYEFAQSYGHMELNQATPAELDKWRRAPRAWREGFAAAAKTMGLSIIGDQLLMQKTAKARPDAPQDMKDLALDAYGVDLDNGKALTSADFKTEYYAGKIRKLRMRRGECIHCRTKCAPEPMCKHCTEKGPRTEVESWADKTAALTALPHQDNVADKVTNTPGQVVVHGLGSGKTFTAIHSARKNHLPLLAVVPAALRNNFKKELSASNFEFPSKVVSYQEAMNKKDNPEFRDFASKSLLTFDEAHRMGQTTSDRSILTHALPAKKKLLMTATPIRNGPEEIVPLINSVSPGTFPDDPEEFRKKFIGSRDVPVGFWGRLKGVQPGKENIPINLHEFQKAVKGKVDFYESADRTEYPSHDEKIVQVPMSNKQEAAYNFVMGRYPTFAYRVRHGLPLNRRADQDFQAFMIGPRQVSNHPAGFNSSANDHDAPKIHSMVNEMEKRYKKDRNFRGVAYSSFLESGINPLSRELQRRKIPHAIFTGDINDKERGEIVKNYNAGKNPVLLISGAGSEGLDLKGTKLMQIMEPHWQDSLIDQVRGRAIRYKSHSHLPESERHVEVQRFHTIPKQTLWDRLLGRKRAKDQSVDEYIYDMAKKKESLNNAFMDAMQSNQKAAEFTQWTPVDNQSFPGLLVDLDKTIVTQPGGFSKQLGTQVVLPNRMEVLQQFKDKGYKIVGVTNRALMPGEQWGIDDLMSLNRETLELFKGLLDDIVCCAFTCEHQKPAPTMLFSAMQNHGLDPNNTIFVGDSPEDCKAADAAKLPFYWAEEFFSNPQTFLQMPEATPAVKISDWTDERNMQAHAIKHGPEFGGPAEYLALEKEIASAPPVDMKPINRRCTTQFLPGGKEVTRCATGFHSASTGLLHVKDDVSGKTVTLYRKPMLLEGMSRGS